MSQIKFLFNLSVRITNLSMGEKLNKFKKLGKTFDKEYKVKVGEMKAKKGLSPYKKKRERKRPMDYLEEEE